jgi:hypothetical protein
MSLWLYKENNKLRDPKNLLLYMFPPELHTLTWYDFIVLTSLTHPKKILLVLLQMGNRKSQTLISTPT